MPHFELDEPTQIPANSPRQAPAWRRMVATAVAMLASVAFGVVLTLAVQHSNRTIEPSLPSGMANYEPRNEEERALLKQLRAPTYSESAAMLRAVKNEIGLQGLRQYVATGDIVLPSTPFSEIMHIALPPGTKWKGGPLINVRLILAGEPHESLPLAFRDGTVLYNRWCVFTEYAPADGKSCQEMDDVPSSEAGMHRSLQKLSPAEQQTYVDLGYVHPDVPLRDNVYLATGKVILHPYVGAKDNAPVIILDNGAYIGGGKFGKIQVIAPSERMTRNPEPTVLYDPVYAATLTNKSGGRVCGYLSDEVKANYPGTCPA